MPLTRRSCSVALIAVAFMLGTAHAADTQGAADDYRAAMKRMDQAMMQAEDPDPAIAFAEKMRAHHQGAIDMSEIVLKSSKDAAIQKIAKKTISEQKQGIKELDDWLKEHGG